MPGFNRSHVLDLRGVLRMAVDATGSVADVVEKMHRTIQLRPGPLGNPVSDRTWGITGLVYRSVLGGIHLVGRAVDTGLAGVADYLPEGETQSSLDSYRSVVNGIYGDYLARTANPLAISMSLRYRGQRADPHDLVQALQHRSEKPAPNRVLLLVHGLCMNDRQWNRDGHDHGEALARELGYRPLYLRYNSGQSVAHNGLALARLLETLVESLDKPLDELAIVGHSMGGLVARSACHQGREAGHAWPNCVRALVFLGTPHHGAPLERGGHGLDRLLELSPYSMPLTRLSKARSVGITDLRNGKTVAGNKIVPLPSGVNCYAAAAVRAAKRSVLSDRLIGDGLVPLDSALGRHRDSGRDLGIAKSRQWIGYNMGHLELLNRPDVYRQIAIWLRESR